MKKWMKPEDKMPEKEVKVFVYDAFSKEIKIAYYNGNDWETYPPGDLAVAYWMPIEYPELIEIDKEYVEYVEKSEWEK